LPVAGRDAVAGVVPIHVYHVTDDTHQAGFWFMTYARHYQHRCVSDLAWAVSSPPLLDYRGGGCRWFSGEWYREQYRQIEGQLAEIDRDPARLEGLLAAQKDQRLGNYFETLWAFALEMSPRYSLVERNLQIVDGQHTLGEMDFIVHDNDTGRHAHWELAIKFYLGIGDTARHDAWHGPGKKDRLDLKINHLLSRQTRLSSNPVARAELERRGIEIGDCAVILKGRLFYPWQRGGPGRFPLYANPLHPDGAWLTRRQVLHSYGADARFMPLIRSGWMAGGPVSPERAFSIKDLLHMVDGGQLRLPLHVSRLGAAPEQERLFIVDNDWPAFPKT